MSENKHQIKILPEWKLSNDFPWQIFAIGWICILKGVIWISLDPNLDEKILTIFGYKYIITMVPFIVLGVGIWNLRKWAVKGITFIVIADLIFFILLFPYSYDSLMVYEQSMLSGILFICLMITNGPLGDVIILCLFPAMLKYGGEFDQYCK